MKHFTSIKELKDCYRTLKLQVGDHRGINAIAHAEKIGFDVCRVIFDRMDNKYGRELQAYVNETGTYCYTLADLIADIQNSDFNTYEIDFIGREWRNREHTKDPKERCFDPVIFVKKESANAS